MRRLQLFISGQSRLWPITGLGGALGFTYLADIFIFWTGRTGPLDGYFIGVATSLVCIPGLIYGSYWLAKSDIPPDRYYRLTIWCFGSLLVFLLLNIGFMWTLPPDSQFQAFSWIRWAIATGGAVGLLIGIFEARAINRGVTIEKTRVRNTEIERERDSLEEFAQIVSHDVKSPLSVANGHLRLAQDRYGEDEHLRAIGGALDRIEEIIKETLTLARQGKTVDQTTAVDISEIAQVCWRTVSTKDAELLIESSETIHADRDRLQHVFENLFRNAVEHAGEDVTIRVGMLPDSSGFYVEDDGPGISDEKRSDVRTIGYTSSDSGTGAGLAIVDRIVEAHGWELRITEGTDGGARFEITGIDIGEP